jgi:glycyl-tRNA synthetase
LVKNNPEIVSKAQEIHKRLRGRWNVFHDASGAIGKRYKRMDEIGTPYSVTVDFDRLKHGALTIRDRESVKQDRISLKERIALIYEEFF